MLKSILKYLHNAFSSIYSSVGHILISQHKLFLLPWLLPFSSPSLFPFNIWKIHENQTTSIFFCINQFACPWVDRWFNLNWPIPRTFLWTCTKSLLPIWYNGTWHDHKSWVHLMCFSINNDAHHIIQMLSTNCYSHSGLGVRI